MLNCKINGTVHIFFFLKSIAQPPVNETAPIFFLGEFSHHIIIMNCSGTLEQKIILFGFFHQYLVPLYWWKNPKSMIFCSRVHEQLYSRLVIFSDFSREICLVCPLLQKLVRLPNSMLKLTRSKIWSDGLAAGCIFAATSAVDTWRFFWNLNFCHP